MLDLLPYRGCRAERGGNISENSQVLLYKDGSYRPCGLKLDVEIRAIELGAVPEDIGLNGMRSPGADHRGRPGEETAILRRRNRRKSEARLAFRSSWR